ncbi:HlyD family type I secretion periplasmic adaptor subunit [Betaproteobacteria bacterium]|nr:HlyD family type I secretion periplasmic adaptor subunit [Betaproteobacteria bacterium]
MKRLFGSILVLFKIIFYPIIYIFKKLPFAIRRRLISNITGFFGFLGKFFIILQHVFSYEKSGKNEQGGSGLMYLILLLFVGFVVWAYFATFDQVITAEGKVYPFSRLQEIEHYEGGLLDKIHVKRGEAVRKNQLLVSLSPLSADSDFNIQKANIALLLIKKERLEAEYLNKKQFSISGDIKEKYLQIFDNEYALFLKRKALFDEEVLKSQNNIQMASARYDAAEAAFNAASEEFDVVTKLYEKGLESRLSKIKSERAFSESVASREIAQQELNKAELELNSLMLDRQAKVLAELSEVKSEYLAAYEGIRVAADKADRTQIRAPIDGIVNRVLISTRGSVVKPGETVVEVVPADQTIVVEANVLPSDIGFVTKDQRAQIKITAYDFSVFGALTGFVSVVGADTITDENGENFYVVKIDLDQDFLAVKNRSLKVIPGMTAQVDIITGKRSPLEYIFSPITKTLQESFREK